MKVTNFETVDHIRPGKHITNATSAQSQRWGALAGGGHAPTLQFLTTLLNHKELGAPGR